MADTDPAWERPKPISRARWSEDWAIPRDPAPLRDIPAPTPDDFWRPIKYIPLNDSGDRYLSFGGEYRLAYEMYDEADMGISDIGRQDAVLHRLALHADFHLNRKWRVFGQLGYAAVNDRDGGEKATDETQIDVWQLFIDRRFSVRNNERFVLRIGRQIIETANVFITAGEANNVRLYYNGVRTAWLTEDFIPFEAFAAEYVDYEYDSFGMSGTDEYFWGFRTGMRVQQPDFDLHFLYLGWDLKDRQFEQGGAGRHDEQRHSLVFWFNRPLTNARQWSLDYYLAYQFGKYEDQPGDSDISAFAGFGEVKYAFFREASTPIVGLKTAYYSGDSDSDDDELNTFYDHVSATPFFGYARDIQPFNLIFIQPNVGYRFGEQISVTLSHGFHWRAETDDGYYGSPNGITARAGASDSSWLGHQTQLSVRYRANPNLLMSSYLARFFSGDMIEDAGGSDRDYFRINIHYLF